MLRLLWVIVLSVATAASASLNENKKLVYSEIRGKNSSFFSCLAGSPEVIGPTDVSYSFFY
jgi:hypothetical protein